MRTTNLSPIYSLIVNLLLSSPSWAQTTCVVSQDAQHTIITTCSTQTLIWVKAGKSQQLVSEVFQGTPFATYPDWQSGSVLLSGQLQPLVGQVAYDQADDQVYYRKDSTQSLPLKPDSFLIGGQQFVSESATGLGHTYEKYYQLLYKGKTRFLKQTKCQLIRQSNSSAVYAGYFQRRDFYFIQRTGQTLEALQLTKKSVEKVLATELSYSHQSLPNTELTESDIIKLLSNSGN